MKTLPTKYIVSKKPKDYLTQGPSHCGAYSVKAILSSYGLDNKSHPKYYHPNWLGRLTGMTLGKQYYVNIFKNYGVSAERGTAKFLSNKERVKLLKELLSQDTPVMIRIGNGYFHSLEYNPTLGRVVAHWITLWGYDDTNQIFYVYDSGLLKEHWNKKIPIGNTTRTYSEILRDWKFGENQPWTWPFSGREDYLYIKVDK